MSFLVLATMFTCRESYGRRILLSYCKLKRKFCVQADTWSLQALLEWYLSHKSSSLQEYLNLRATLDTLLNWRKVILLNPFPYHKIVKKATKILGWDIGSFSAKWQPHHIEQIALPLAIDSSASLQRWHNYNNGKTLRLQTYYCIIEGAPHRAITSHYTPLWPPSLPTTSISGSTPSHCRGKHKPICSFLHVLLCHSVL